MWEPISTDSCEVCPYASRLRKPETDYLDKENFPQGLSPAKNEEISFYGNTSPTAPLCTGTSPNHCNHNIIIRRPLEDHDPNSRDSGYSTNYTDGEKFSSFASPSRGSFESGSIGSMEDDFFEDFSDLEPLGDNLPHNFGKLISGPISGQNKKTTKPSPKDLLLRPLFRRALSLQNTSPEAGRARSCLFKDSEIRSFKRQEHSIEFDSPINSKKLKIIGNEDEEIPAVPSIARPTFKRVFSATEESIMAAVQRSSAEPDLIGDFSKSFSLPLTQGRHQDLKSITSDTLAQLMRGEFNGNIASFKVIDCRYPYEFEGGHIDGALNIYTKEQCVELLNNFNLPKDDSHRRSNILVFHCEFSSERGPNLCRYLREQDRQLNQQSYPALHYPEIYILEGGYKNFFERYSHLCVPVAYKQMLHPEHENDLRYFRQKSKTWNIDTRPRPQRGQFKRLDL